MSKKITTDEFIARAKVVHKDAYNYSLVSYKRMSDPVYIVCAIHGQFTQTPHQHLKGRGCSICGITKNKNNRTRSTDEFIEKAKAVHGDKYDYSLTEYSGYGLPIRLICREHGEFSQVAANHIRGNGCPKCGRRSIVRAHAYTTAKFIDMASEIHSDKYDYSLVNYTGSNELVKIICKQHGMFEQTAISHLSGYGCRLCGIDKVSSDLASDTTSFISKAKAKHGDKYEYANVVYTRSPIKVSITCPKHGDFLQSPSDHLAGYGCPVCCSSKGELLVSNILSKLGIAFSTQVKFPGCRHTSLLKFDFYIPSANTLIEYDGAQHFTNVNFFGGEDGLAKRKLRDSIKTAWAKDNSYNLLRLDYTMSAETIRQKIMEELNIKEVA